MCVQMMALQNFISFFLLLLCLKTLLAGKPYRGKHVRTTSFDTVLKGKALKNHVIEVIHEYSQLDCGLACLRTTDCQSYNARQEKADVVECELSSSTKTQHPNDFVNATGVTYFGSDTFPTLGCDADKCRYKDKCEETKEYPYYLCHDDAFDLKFPSSASHTWKGNSTASLDEISVCFWFKTSHAISGTFFGYKNNGVPSSVVSLAYFYNDLALGINTDHANLTLPSLHDDEWHHLCVTWNSTSGHVNVFVDGVIRGYPSGKSFFKDAKVTPDGTLTLGHFGNNPYSDYTGKMSQFNLWDRVLPSNEIKAMAMTCTLSLTSNGNIVKWGRDFTPTPSESAESRDCSKRDISSEELGDLDLQFLGQDETLSLKTISNIPSLDSFTISWWLKTSWIPTADSQLKAIASFTKELTTTLLVALRGTFEIHFQLGSEQSFHKLPPISDDRWHHMAITWENKNGQWDFYLDGVHRALVNNFQEKHVIEGSFLIIAKNGNNKGSAYTSDEDLVGSLSRLNIWKYRLSVEHIVMLAKHPGFDRGDVASWNDIQQKLSDHVVRTRPSTVVSTFGLSNVRFTITETSHRNYALLPYDGEEIKQLTVCAWIYLVYGSSSSYPCLVSYGSPSNPNEFFLEFTNGNIKSGVNNKMYTLGSDILNNKKWQHFCVSWDGVKGEIHHYVQAKNAGSKTGLSKEVLPSKGIWVATQEQDSFGGGFNNAQSWHKAVAQLNVWNYVLPAKSIEALSYGATNIEGNLLRWSDVVANYNPIAHFTSTPFHLYLPDAAVQKRRDEFCNSFDGCNGGIKYARIGTKPVSKSPGYEWRCYCLVCLINDKNFNFFVSNTGLFSRQSELLAIV